MIRVNFREFLPKSLPLLPRSYHFLRGLGKEIKAAALLNQSKETI